MTPPPLLPWVEANQGLIAIVTLAAALAVALFEQWRSHRAEIDRHGDFRRAIVDLADNLLIQIDDIIARLRSADSKNSGMIGQSEWDELALQTRGSIEQLMPASPPAARVILAATAIKHWLHPARDRNPTMDTKSAIRIFEERRERFTRLRSEFVAAFS